MNNTKRAVAVQEEEVQARPDARQLTLFLEGELGTRELKGLGDHVLALARKGVRHVVVDLSDVGHIDYRGLKTLIERASAFRDFGGDIKLTGLSPYLATILRVAGAHNVFECYREPSSLHEAFIGRARWAH